MVNKAGTMFGDACWVLNHLCEAILGGDTLQLVLKLARLVQIDVKVPYKHQGFEFARRQVVKSTLELLETVRVCIWWMIEQASRQALVLDSCFDSKEFKVGMKEMIKYWYGCLDIKEDATTMMVAILPHYLISRNVNFGIQDSSI